MMGWLRNLFAPKPDSSANMRALERFYRRTFESAKSSRLNEKSWASAGNNTLDSLLTGSLPIMRNRCRYEINNNVYARGIVHTFATDVVGRDGPRLQILSAADESSASAIEELWSEWSMTCNLRGGALPELLGCSVRQFFSCGEFLLRLAGASPRPGEIALRLAEINPSRLADPFTSFSGDVRNGVEVDSNGKPIAYHILRATPGDIPAFASTLQSDAVPAREIIHAFVAEECDQTRGVPWFQATLDAFAHGRDFMQSTLLAARVAAMTAVALYTDNPAVSVENFDSDSLPVADIEPGVMMMVPAGWKPSQIKPEHPATTYGDFRRALLSDYGRCISMPYLRVACDASGHNFSSARLDLQAYWRTVQCIQGMIERIMLARVFREFYTELRLVRPDVALRGRFKTTWTWPPIPQIDPTKEADAARTRLENGTSTLAAECDYAGSDWQDVLAQKAREKAAADAAGVSLVGTNAVAQPKAAAPTEDSNANTGT